MLPHDKALHVIAGFCIFTVAHFISIPVAIYSVVAAAVGKELFDLCHKDRHTPDVLDAVATIAGGLIACLNTY